MIALAIDTRQLSAMDVDLTDDSLSVDLRGGRTITVPLAWYPSVSGFIAGKPSGESQRSLKRRLKNRSQTAEQGET